MLILIYLYCSRDRAILALHGEAAEPRRNLQFLYDSIYVLFTEGRRSVPGNHSDSAAGERHFLLTSKALGSGICACRWEGQRCSCYAT